MTTLLSDWKAAKDKFEAESAKIGRKTKKPAEKACFGLWRKSSGLEPCFKKIDELSGTEPLDGGGTLEKLVVVDDTITNLQQAIACVAIKQYATWEREVTKATAKLHAAASAYQGLLKSSEKTEEYQDLVPLLRGLSQKIDKLVGAADDYGTARTVTNKQLQELKSWLGDLCNVNTLGGKTVGSLNKAIEGVPKNISSRSRRPESLAWPIDKKAFRAHHASCRKWIEGSEKLQAVETKKAFFFPKYKALSSCVEIRETILKSIYGAGGRASGRFGE
jgi:hypothetical protein